MIQIAGKPEIMEIINKIIMGIDVRQASQQQQFKPLQMHAPVIASFISTLVITEEIPPDVRELFRQLKDLCLAPFVTQNGENFPPPEDDDFLSCSFSSKRKILCCRSEVLEGRQGHL